MVAIRTIESRVAIRNHVDPVQLSIQEMINCMKDNPKEAGRQNCFPGSINHSFRWITDSGVLPEDECRFVGYRQLCSPNPI